MQKPVKILITGPESTGKSTLCTLLAEKYNSVWVKEYVREYFENLDREYCYEDLKLIGKEQFQRQNETEKTSSDFLFCDTGLEVIKIWSEHKYQKCDQWIIDHLSKQNFDIVFLLDIDIPWEFDELRENPSKEDRHYFIELYKKELSEIYGHFYFISGSLSQRVLTVEEILAKKAFRK